MTEQTAQNTRRWAALAFVFAILLVAHLAAAADEPEKDQKANSASPSSVIRYWNPKEAMTRGGVLMWPILLCSIIVITFGLERWVSLRRQRVIPRSFVNRFFDALRRDDLYRAGAMELCRLEDAPIASVFRAAVRHWGRTTVEIEQAVTEAGQQQIALLRRNLRTLQGAANLATLLGLLGTILGMIQAFNKVARSQGMDRAVELADGIAEALLTTAAGLTVAIPAVFLYNYFAGRVERLVTEMDELATNVVDAISAESLESNRAEHPNTAKRVAKHL